MRAGAARSALQGPDASKGRNLLCAMLPREALVWAQSALTQAFRVPIPEVAGQPAGFCRRTEPPRSSSRWTSSDCEQLGRSGRLPRYANWSPRSCPFSIPLHASRTTASSPVRVLPPLTPAAPNQRLAFLLRKGDRVALFEPGQASHTNLSFSEYEAIYTGPVLLAAPKE
jgi:hypothetical protein